MLVKLWPKFRHRRQTVTTATRQCTASALRHWHRDPGRGPAAAQPGLSRRLGPRPGPLRLPGRVLARPSSGLTHRGPRQTSVNRGNGGHFMWQTELERNHSMILAPSHARPTAARDSAAQARKRLGEQASSAQKSEADSPAARDSGSDSESEALSGST